MPKFTKVNPMQPYEMQCFILNVHNSLTKSEPNLTSDEKEVQRLLLKKHVYWNIHNTPNPVALGSLINKLATLIPMRCDEMYKQFVQENNERQASAHAWIAVPQLPSHAECPQIFFNVNGIQQEKGQRVDPLNSEPRL